VRVDTERIRTYYTVMVDKERAAVITIRLTRDERMMVGALADADGISISDVVRMALRRTYAERFADKKTKKTK
jgi:uncharacterized protein (DUF1778 family)